MLSSPLPDKHSTSSPPTDASRQASDRSTGTRPTFVVARGPDGLGLGFLSLSVIKQPRHDRLLLQGDLILLNMRRVGKAHVSPAVSRGRTTRRRKDSICTVGDDTTCDDTGTVRVPAIIVGFHGPTVSRKRRISAPNPDTSRHVAQQLAERTSGKRGLVSIAHISNASSHGFTRR